FETVTIAYKGAVAHHDSFGNSGIIYPGDVQWMTAGKGILHKEYHEVEYAKKGGPFEMIQLWVNLPKQYKMTEPKYKAIQHDQKGKLELDKNAGSVFIIAGEYNSIKGAATTFSPVNLFDIRLKAQGEVDLTLASDFNTGLLVVEGEAIVNEQHGVKATNYIQFKNTEGNIHIKATKDSIFLLLSGEAINEPVANYGPFVMNTVQEIQEAIDDFNKGKFGFLEN
ncbi:MAG TPA: pirin family protein, partial [Saprospiraceae bacterium]|nr:pirin family protein [Saprospiraceae bacterium]